MSVSPDQSFEYRLRVRYAECDAQGVVFNARYADYVDLAMNEYIRVLFGDYQNLLDRDLDIQVVSLTLNWQAPARFDEVLSVRATLKHLGNTSFSLALSFHRHPDGDPLAEAAITYVMIQPSTMSKTQVPDDLRAILETGAPGRMISHAGEDQSV